MLKYKTDGKFKIILISLKDLKTQKINLSKIDINSIQFENMPEDTSIINYIYDFDCSYIKFLVEHESFDKIPLGAIPLNFCSKIINCIRLIKLSKNFLKEIKNINTI